MFLYIFKIIIKLIITSSRFNPCSTSVRPQNPWTSPFYGSMNGPGLKTLHLPKHLIKPTLMVLFSMIYPMTGIGVVILRLQRSNHRGVESMDSALFSLPKIFAFIILSLKVILFSSFQPCRIVDHQILYTGIL